MMNTKTPKLYLRPHHLLCLQSFVGHGYSEEFVREMAYVKQQLMPTPHASIELVHGPDMLCRHCPNCVNGCCTSDKPDIFDQSVEAKIEKAMKTLLSRDSESNHGDISSGPLLLHGIPEYLTLSHSLLEECCPNCQWKDLCSEVISFTLPTN